MRPETKAKLTVAMVVSLVAFGFGTGASMFTNFNKSFNNVPSINLTPPTELPPIFTTKNITPPNESTTPPPNEEVTNEPPTSPTSPPTTTTVPPTTTTVPPTTTTVPPTTTARP